MTPSTHYKLTYEADQIQEPTAIDVIEHEGALWFSPNEVLPLMGFIPHPKDGFSRRLKRVTAPDIIKIKDTNFRFPDKRRNRGSLISPRGIIGLSDGKTQGRNTIASTAFIEWMKDSIFVDGKDAASCSPEVPSNVELAPVFRRIEQVLDQDEAGRALDPLRPCGVYIHATTERELADDEVEFCLCSEREGLGRCWCGGKGRIRSKMPQQHNLDEVSFLVIDEDDAW